MNKQEEERLFQLMVMATLLLAFPFGVFKVLELLVRFGKHIGVLN